MHPVWWVALILLALCTAHSKFAGALWGLMFLVGAWLEFKARPTIIQDPVTRAAKTWLLICMIVTVIWMFCAFMFDELLQPQSGELNAGVRLVVGALGVWWLVRAIRSSNPERSLTATNFALIAGCLVALFIAVTEDRATYPSNAIIWSSAIAFWMVILAGEAIRPLMAQRVRHLCMIGVLIGIVAILVSRTRGAYPVLLWPLVLLVVSGTGSPILKRHWRGLVTVLVIGSVMLGATASWWGDKLRLSEAISDVRGVQQEANFNTSTGVRVYLLTLGWQVFRESPYIGIGATERKRRIHTAGLGESRGIEDATQSARKLGHVHNAYLHHAMDGGLISLTGFLLTIGGLIVIGYTLRRHHSTSAYQLYGIAVVHAVTNISSVNFSHNYYSLVLAISVGVVLLQARLASLIDQPS
jgi:uncharacterized membrane protein